MKKILLLSLFAFMGLTAFSQTSTQEYKAGNEGWLVKVDEAYEQSKKTGKPIMANFTGSDWCGWCKKLTRTVFSKPEFKKWAAENVILLELDFPRRTKVPDEIRQQNAQLQKAFQVRGFPTVWVFNLNQDDGGQFNVEALGKTGYAKSAKEFTDGVDQIIAQGKKK